MNVDNPDERLMLFMYLKHVVLLLAMPGVVMLEIFRNQKATFVGAISREAQQHFLEAVFAEEIVVEFAIRREAVVERLGGGFTVAQKGCLAALDAFLEAMGGSANKSLYTPEAVLKAQEWDHIRRLATMVADSFGWDVELPIHYGWSYCDYRWRDELPELSVSEAQS